MHNVAAKFVVSHRAFANSERFWGLTVPSIILLGAGFRKSKYRVPHCDSGETAVKLKQIRYDSGISKRTELDCCIFVEGGMECTRNCFSLKCGRDFQKNIYQNNF